LLEELPAIVSEEIKRGTIHHQPLLYSKLKFGGGWFYSQGDEMSNF
jgi:hypothetical protein